MKSSVSVGLLMSTACLLAQSNADFPLSSVLWSPMNTLDTTDNSTREAVCFSWSRPTFKPKFTIEAEAEGQKLATASGYPDRMPNRCVPAPVHDLLTYKITRLTIEVGGHRLVLDNPPQRIFIHPDD